jgi:hypothetical protein
MASLIQFFKIICVPGIYSSNAIAVLIIEPPIYIINPLTSNVSNSFIGTVNFIFNSLMLLFQNFQIYEKIKYLFLIDRVCGKVKMGVE